MIILRQEVNLKRLNLIYCEYRFKKIFSLRFFISKGILLIKFINPNNKVFTSNYYYSEFDYNCDY